MGSKGKCPSCGRPLVGSGNCPVCSTEPLPEITLDTIADIDPPTWRVPGPAVAGAAAAGRPDLANGEVTQVTQVPFELRAPYTGRTEVLARLTEVCEEAFDQRRLAFAVLIGEPGLGKSQTIKELARTLARTRADLRVLVGGTESGGLYAPLARVLAARFGIAPGEPMGESREKIIAGVAEVMPAARVTETAHLIAHLMQVPFPDSAVLASLAGGPPALPVAEPALGDRVRAVASQKLEARTFLALRRFLAADADAGPLLLCFENLELAEPESINLLHYLVAGLAGSPVVILGSAREALFDRHPSFGDVDTALERIDLRPLSDAESERLVAALLRPLDRVPERLVAHARSLGGSPRALYDLVRFLLESNVVVRSGGAEWRIDERALAAARLPRSHEELVAERVRVMSPEDRDVLEMAAVVGETFWLDGVVALVRVARAGAEPGDRERPAGATAREDPDGPTLAQIAAAGGKERASAAYALTRLVEREWVVAVEPSSVPGEREFRFAYPYLRSAVYEGVSPARRRVYHRMVAQYLELRPEGRAAMAQEDVARHLELAGEAGAAAARYRRAADYARMNFESDRAVRLYSQALACLGEADLAARIHLWHDLGSVYELRGDYEAALGGFERMLRLAWVCASRTKAAVAFNKMGRVWRRKGDVKLALEYLERGLELFEQVDDHRGIAGSLDDIGTVLWLLGRYDEAEAKVTQGLARRGKGGDKRSIAHSLSNLGNIQKARGRFAEALACHREALEIRRQIGDRVGGITSLNNLAVLAFERGDHGEARGGWEQALKEAEEVGALPLQALALCNLGELALVEPRPEEARRRLDEALEIAEEIDDRQLVVETTRNLALLEHGGGAAPRARQLAQKAYQVAVAAGLRDCEGRALLTLGHVFEGSLNADPGTTQERPRPGAPTMAETYFSRGLEVLREIGNEGELARGLERFGRYKIEHGDTGAGVDLLRQALVIFSKLGMKEQREVEKVLAAV